ncbi:MAG: hypothetical protein GF347_00605 [Candidatus Moranbacteria bacterium]|nr:hypothetical protein [Candidatus Moranbacteria bacterium]
MQVSRVRVLAYTGLTLLLPSCASQVEVQRVYLPVVNYPPFGGHGVGTTYDDFEVAYNLGADWVYNWGIPEDVPWGLYPAAMVWCTTIPKGLEGYPVILWGNEPDIASQCNKSPQEYADFWNENVGAYGDTYNVAPAVAHVEWLEEFLPLLSVAPDAISVHCYGHDGGPDCKGFITQFRTFGYPVIVSEWAWIGTDPQEAADYIVDMMAWFDANRDWIIADAYFQARYEGTEPWAFGPEYNTSLVDWERGDLTPQGRAFRSMAIVVTQ